MRFNKINLIESIIVRFIYNYIYAKKNVLFGAIKVHNQTIIKQNCIFFYYLHSNYVTGTQRANAKEMRQKARNKKQCDANSLIVR